MRAYALATELGLAREELIKKAAEIGIEIRNPMASLDEEQVNTIRRRLAATPAADTVQKRVGSSVIRRRKRKEDETRPELEELPEGAAAVAAHEPAFEAEVEQPALAAAAPAVTSASEPAQRPSEPRVVAPLDRPARIVEDPLANQPQPAAAEATAAAASRPGTAATAPATETEEREAPDQAARRAPRQRPVRTDVTLREQETIARMMRGGNVQAQLERRRSIVEQQSRTQSGRRRVTPPPRKLAPPNPAKIKRTVKIAGEISFVDFSRDTGVKVRDLIRRARALEPELASEEFLEGDIAALVAEELGFAVQRVESEIERKIAATRTAAPASEGEPRPPVVTVMGHVDHGKTSLLDYIRKAKVAAGEAGGITQHIGAYQARALDGSLVTFIDTPGHAAFSAMRARGAQLTDLVVLVVAADDGVMPQTIEAISHARAAGVPIVVAVNKVDKSDANPQRVRQALLEHQLVAEDFGGDTIFVDVSATKGTGVEKLLEMLALQAEVLELRAPSKGPARGAVLEAELDRGRGPLATVLVREGTLRPGDAIVAGSTFGRVRSLQDSEGNTVKEAGPSTPVRVIGLSGVPLAGDDFFAAESEREAKQIVEHRITEEKQKTAAANENPSAVSAEELFARMAGAENKELFAVVKADVQGTVEAIREALGKLSTEKVKLSVIHSGVGGIKESDVMLAAASKAVIFGFHVRPEPAARKLAEREGVTIRTFDIVYELLDDATLLMRGLLPPKETEKLLGHALVKELFHIPKIGTIAGSGIEDGRITRAARARVLRNGIVIYAGKLSSLRRFKDDVREVAAPLECGIGIENFNDVKVGDRIEAYEIEATPDTL
ncbi:MAG TPA: translation initiation factor IF-2 [Myxococcota bacterium]|nr:translation initiation factor IF-2 [Myxococcota bacterium]